MIALIILTILTITAMYKDNKIRQIVAKKKLNKKKLLESKTKKIDDSNNEILK